MFDKTPIPFFKNFIKKMENVIQDISVNAGTSLLTEKQVRKGTRSSDHPYTTGFDLISTMRDSMSSSKEFARQFDKSRRCDF